MDYEGEQEMEMEALQAILMDDIQGTRRCSGACCIGVDGSVAGDVAHAL